MEKMSIDQAADFNGQEIRKGDTVATMGDNVTAKICDLCEDGDLAFVRLRPTFQPYGRGIWHAADRVVLINSAARKNGLEGSTNSVRKSQPAKAALVGGSRGPRKQT